MVILFFENLEFDENFEIYTDIKFAKQYLKIHTFPLRFQLCATFMQQKKCINFFFPFSLS